MNYSENSRILLFKKSYYNHTILIKAKFLKIQSFHLKNQLFI